MKTKKVSGNLEEEKNVTNHPNHIIKNMYLEINNIAQGINIGIFVFVLATPSFYYFEERFFSTPILTLASLLISVIFWARYYFDTEILNRSFTILSAVWFFCYLISQGISISLVTQPSNWLLGTGVFLFFGAGFYGLNLFEIRRKKNLDTIILPDRYVRWQRRRMIELMVLSVLSIIGSFVVTGYPPSALPAAFFAFGVAVWQLVLTNDYRKNQFIETGV